MKGTIFTYLLTYGGALAALFNPFVGFLVYISLAILTPHYLWQWSSQPANAAHTVGIALLAGWVLAGFGRWNLGRAWAVILSLLGYFIWMILSASFAPDQELAWAYVEHFAKIVLPILVGITTLRSVRQLKLLAWVIVLSHAYVAFELNLAYFNGYNRMKEEGFGGMDNNCFAIALVTCMGLAGFLFWHAEKWWQKCLALGCGAFIVHCILISFSRGGMLGLCVLGLAAFVVMPKGRKEYLAFALALVVALSFVGKEVLGRFETAFAAQGARDASAQGRLVLWAACWDTMLKHPVLGVGPDYMPHVMVDYGFPEGKEAHTLWLNVGAELGFPGMALLMSYYGLCAARLWPIARGRAPVSDPWLTHLARAVIASLCGFAVSAQFVALDFLEAPYYVAILGAGVLKLSTNRSTP